LDINRLSKALVYITRVYYGLNPENVADDVYRVVIAEVITKYKTLTFLQLNLAYSECTIEKRQGVSLTKGELMQPIEDMWHKKGVIESIAKQNLSEYEEKQNAFQIAQQFKEDAMSIYLQDLADKNKVYSGSDFQASSFAKNFEELFTSDELEAFKLDAKRLHRELSFQFENSKEIINLPPAGEDKIYCKVLLNNALNRGMNGYLLIKD